MLHRFVLLALVLLPSAVVAQQVGPVAVPARAFESWEPAGLAGYSAREPVRGAVLESKDRTGNAVLGGVIGALAGVAFCTVVSNIVKDEGTGFSTCTTSGYLLTGGVGFALGLLVGLSV